MAIPDDLATLWSFGGRLRCVLTPVDGEWQVRIEDGQDTVRSNVAETSDQAIAIADRWLRDLHGGTLPAEKIVVRNDHGMSNLTEAGQTIVVGRLAQQLLEIMADTGGMLEALNDDPRLKAIASDALVDVAEASRLLDRANATIADVR